jgi:uncharacterized heparinase superfamily protein
MFIGCYYRSASHTRLSQLIWRAHYMLARRRKLGQQIARRWGWLGARSPRLRDDFPSLPLPLRAGERGLENVVELTRGEFRFLNQNQQLGRQRPDWRLRTITSDRLWTITLHYHGWAYDLAEAGAGSAPNAAEAAALFQYYLSDWMTRCSLGAPGARELAWNAYAIATRLTWWIRAYQLLGHERFPDEFKHAFLASLWQQAAYLRDHLEWDLRANHLLRDAVGLAWAGRFFAEDRAAEWLRTATRLAVEQVAEQTLPDGGHFERSPMYHLHVMEDTLSLALLLEDGEARTRLRDTWAAMAEFLMWLRHPDGDLALFNDGGLQGADHVEHLLQLGSRIGVSLTTQSRRGGRYFSDTGMVVWHGDPWTVFFDVGPVGPDYQPGHAHADTLSLECSYRGRRLFVDAGTYAYDRDERRRYDRGTAAHNTVCVDGQDSSEVWHIFRVGRRAYPREVRADFAAGGVNAAAAHDGYKHLPGRPLPARCLTVGRDGRMIIQDSVSGRGRHLVEGGFLVSPEWTAAAEPGGWLLKNGERTVRVMVRGSQELALFQELRCYHPEYGRELPATRLGWRVQGDLPLTVSTFMEGV